MNVDQTNREMDYAMIDAVARHFDRADVAANLRAQIERGEPMARLVEIAKALNCTIDELLTEFLDAVERRTGERYEVHGFLLKARVN